MTELVNMAAEGDHLYTAGLLGREVQLYAASLFAAKEAAIKYFKPSKKNMGLLWVVLNSSPEAMI